MAVKRLEELVPLAELKNSPHRPDGDHRREVKAGGPIML